MPIFGVIPTSGENLYSSTLRNQVVGNGNSPAQRQLMLGYLKLREGLANQAHSNRANPMLAERNAMLASARAGSEFNLQKAQLRAQEQQGALAMQGQDAARSAAGLNAFAGNMAGIGAGLGGLAAQMAGQPGQATGPNATQALTGQGVNQAQGAPMPAPTPPPPQNTGKAAANAASISAGAQPFTVEQPQLPPSPFQGQSNYIGPDQYGAPNPFDYATPAGSGPSIQPTATNAVPVNPVVGGLQPMPQSAGPQVPLSSAGAAGISQAQAPVPTPQQPPPPPPPPTNQGGSGILEGLGKVASFAGSLAPLLMSDQRAKKKIADGNGAVGQFLDALSANNFEYRDQANGAGPQTGVMAQSLARTPIGRQMVVQDPASGMLGIDPSRAAGPNLAAMAYLNDRLNRLERHTSSSKPSGAAPPQESTEDLYNRLLGPAMPQDGNRMARARSRTRRPARASQASADMAPFMDGGMSYDPSMYGDGPMSQGPEGPMLAPTVMPPTSSYTGPTGPRSTSLEPSGLPGGMPMLESDMNLPPTVTPRVPQPERPFFYDESRIREMRRGGRR